MMDGRDFGPHRSVHVPSPLLTGLAMESHRLGAATAAGRIASSPGHLATGHPTPLLTGKYMSPAMNLHSHHGDAFPVNSSPFLSGYVNGSLGGSSTPHGTPASLPAEPSFRAPAPSNLQMAQLWASHPHKGFSHLPNSLYPSPYIPLSHLEHPSSGSSLLAQLSQHGLYESQKEGFYLSGHAGQSALHPQSSISRATSNQMPSSLLREKDVVSHHKSAKDLSRDSSREKPCRTDLNLSHPRRERERHREEPRPRSVVDLTQEPKLEGSERKVSGLDRSYKTGEHTSSLFYREHSPGLGGGEPKSKNPLQTSSLSNCNSGGSSSSVKYQGSEQERGAKDPSRHDENMRPSAYVHADKPKKFDAVVTYSSSSSVGSSYVSCSCPSTHSNASQPAPRVLSSNTFPPTHHAQASLYTLYPSAKEPAREHKVIAPTFVPSVEVYHERNGPIQIASQARDNKNDKNRDNDGNKPGCLQAPSERTLVDPVRPPHTHESPLHVDVKRMEMFREEGSVIMSNCMATKRPASSELFPIKAGHSPDTRDLLLNSATSKEMMKMVLEAEARSQERERLQRAAARDSSKMYNVVDSSRIHVDQHQLKNSSPTEPKWKPFEMGSYATNQMAALAAQHGHGNRGGEEEGKAAYPDPSGLQRSTVVGNSRGSSEVLHPGSHGEVSAMQSLIKYSGNFAKETSARPNGGIRSPFGGLGNMKLEANPLGMSKVQHLPPQQCGKQLKRDPERPESAKSFGRESIGSQGEVEVRHPPVGIAVAVARQKDNTSKPSSNLGDREQSIPVGSIKGSGHTDEDRMDDRSRHRDDRLLAGRLEREQEKLLRESKELADFARIHQPGVSTSGLNPNLMVTGGPSLAGPGRWPTDPESHLASHHWIPRTGSSSMWLAGSPYGLGHPSLHQGMAPGYHPGMPGSIPSSYQFARDPQSGQLLVIPTDHLPHFAELMERAPPLWSTMYPPTGSSLQHAHQLQLLSHQQLLRQHELYMLQQQATQAMELQRSAQLVETLKACEHRAEMEDKAAKRSHEGAKQGLPAACAPTLHSRKPPSPSPAPSTSYGKALTPRPPTPSPSPVTILKSEVRQKIEEAVPQQPYSHPSTPAPHPSSPALASPHTRPPIPPKKEAPEEMEKKDIDLQKGPFQALFPEIPQGYPFQSITARFGSHYPYLLQPAAASDADGLAPDVPLQVETSEHLSASVEVKPMRLHPPAMVESLQPAVGPEPMEESAVNKEESDLEETQQSLGDQNGSMALDNSVPEELELVTKPENQSGMERQTDEMEQEQEDNELQKGGGTAGTCQTSYRLIDCAPEVEPQPEEPEEQAHSVHADFDNSMAYCGPEVQEVKVQRESASKAEELYDEADEKETVAVPSSTTEPPTEDLSIKEGFLSSQIAQLDTLNIRPDDPMAGMIALVAASELPQTCSLPTHYTPTAVLSALKMTDDCSSVDPAGLHGIALLSEIAELELERRKNEIRYTMRADLESLLVAGTQVLMEALACKPAVTIQLPRELNPNKKYSWMQKKDEPLFSIKSAIEGMGAMELDYRVRLAELQRRYKDKQRELAKLQKHRDAEEIREEKNRSLSRRGPGRPRKRKHSLASLPVGKSDCKGNKLGKSFLLSEDMEMGEGLRKRFRGLSAEDEDEMDGVSVKVKRKSKSWDTASSSFSQEVQTKSKKKKENEQEQLATKLDKALSLTKLSQLGKSPFKFANSSVGKSKSSSGSCSKRLGSHEMEGLGQEGKKNLSQSLSISQKSSKEGKNKMAAKTKKMEFGMKVKGHLKASTSPARSEVSSYSYSTDTEEEGESAKHGWPSHSALSNPGSRGRPSRLHGSAFTKSRQSPKRGLSTSSSSSAGTLKSKQAANKKRHKHFALLLQEAEARSSFSDSSEDSFDQGY